MLRSADKWFPDYLLSLLRRPGRVSGTRHLVFCFVDHFEPFRRETDASGKSSVVAPDRARGLVKTWVDRYPALADGIRDADGRPPRHTFFYPQEEYDANCVDLLAGLCAKGFGEVEIHLHHRNDTPEGLRQKLVEFRDTLHNQHGLLGRRKGFRVQETGDRDQRSEGSDLPLKVGGQSAVNPVTLTQCNSVTSPIAYGFIHGNWSLCNSLPDGDWCGVNEELGILRKTGCFADFTFPSAPSPTQPRMVNSIYRAVDTPGRPRGFDRGQPVRRRPREGGRSEVRSQGSGVESDHDSGSAFNPRQHPTSDNSNPNLRKSVKPACSLPNVGRAGRSVDRFSSSSLLLIQGPLGLDWRRRKWGVLPRLENADVSAGTKPTADRADLWVRQGIHVAGRPEWVFVKVHTHGCVDANRNVILGPQMRAVHEYLSSRYNDGKDWQLHYATAREMYNIVRAAEDGHCGSPGEYRDYEILPPGNRPKTEDHRPEKM